MVCENRFKDRVAIVTGGSRGIGLATAKRLVSEGAEVYAIHFKKNIESISVDSREISVISCDVSNFYEVAGTIKAIYEKAGKVDILVNSAGITRDKIFHKMTSDTWKEVMDVNLTGVFNTMNCVIPLMREKKYGRIVNVSSTSAYGTVGQANYSASKAGLIGLTKTVAKEAAKYNITVNAVLPDFTETDMIKDIPKDVYEEMISALPIGRISQAEEQASAICYLASEEASYISGVALNVDGATN